MLFKISTALIIEKTIYNQDKFKAIKMNLDIGIATEEPNIEQAFEETFETYGYNTNTLFIQITYAEYLTFLKNKPEEAIEVLEKAMQFANSKYVQARIKLKLGDVLVFTKNFNKALIYFSQVQTKFKNHILGQEARFKVARTSYFKNDFDWAKAQLKVLKGSATQLIANDATELFLTITDNQPKDSIATGLKEYAKAELLAYQQKNKEAIEVLSTLSENFQNQPIEDEALYKKAVLLVKEN